MGELPSVDDLEVAAAAAAAAMEALEEQARGIAADAAHSSSEVRNILVVWLPHLLVSLYKAMPQALPWRRSRNQVEQQPSNPLSCRMLS